MIGTFFIFIACFLWAVDTLVRYPLVMKGIHPFTIVFYEHVLLTLCFSLSLIPAIKRFGELKLSHIFSFFIIGGLGSAIATVAFTESFIYLNPSLVILLQKFQPIIAIALASIVLKEKVEKFFLFWAFICLIGGVPVSFPDLERFYELMKSDFSVVISDTALKGYGLVGVSILGWGSATVFGKKLTKSGFETKAILGGRFFIGMLTLIPFVKWSRSMVLPEGSDYGRILIMVVASGIVAMYFYYQGLKRLPAKISAIAEMFFPLCAIVINWVILDKQLSVIQLYGAGLLIAGSFILQLKKYET